MRIQDVMSKKVVTIDPSATVEAARERLRAAGIDHLVVLEDKRLTGIVAGRDLDRADGDRPVSAVMTRSVVTIEPDATLRHAAGVMRGRAIGCLPVLDGERLVGIVTTSDFLTALAKGEIHAAPPRERVVLRKRGQRKPPATL